MLSAEVRPGIRWLKRRPGHERAQVVRIVTREELLAQSNAIAARLDAAVRRWKAAARAAGEVTQGELAHSRESQARWLQELHADRFTAFNEGANREIDFLKADADRRREVAAARRADARLSRARASQNAALLIKTLDGKKVAVERSLRDMLEATAAGRGDSKVPSECRSAPSPLVMSEARLEILMRSTCGAATSTS